MCYFVSAANAPSPFHNKSRVENGEIIVRSLLYHGGGGAGGMVCVCVWMVGPLLHQSWKDKCFMLPLHVGWSQYMLLWRAAIFWVWHLNCRRNQAITQIPFNELLCQLSPRRAFLPTTDGSVLNEGTRVYTVSVVSCLSTINLVESCIDVRSSYVIRESIC